MGREAKIMKLLIMNLVVGLGWLATIALAQLQLGDAITGSVPFPEAGITCIGNLAAFVTILLRRRLDLEMGARDVLATKASPKFSDQEKNQGVHRLNIDEGDQKPVVVMLSTEVWNHSIRAFMQYIYNTHGVNSILLEFFALKSASAKSALDSESVTVELCAGNCNCNCIVFRTSKEITKMLACKMPGTLKGLSDSICLLPCLQCLEQGHHECHEEMLDGEGNPSNLSGGDAKPNLDIAVCEALNFEETTVNKKRPICICIPVLDRAADKWTELLIRAFKSKDQEDRGVNVMASDALQSYLDGRVEEHIREEPIVFPVSNLILPRVIEISIDVALTAWLKVDGFTSAVLARRAIRHYIVDRQGNAFAANAFLTEALVIVKPIAGHNSSVCQVLSFRSGTLVGIRSLSFIVGCVNLICALGWALVVALERGTDKWYEVQAITPSKPRIAVLIAFICIGWIMDFCELFYKKSGWDRKHKRAWFTLLALIVVEITCSVYFIAVAATLGIKKGFGRWVYSVLQGLVWVKWMVGSYLLGSYTPENIKTPSHSTEIEGIKTVTFSSQKWVNHGTLVYSSAFLLNGILAGVRSKWK